jgi:hypothetical protein
MSHIHVPDEIPVQYLERSSGLKALYLTMFLVGFAVFAWTFFVNPALAWQSYVSNWLFFTSIAIGAVLFGVATSIVRAKWNWSVRRIPFAFSAFLPFSFLLFLPMAIFLREDYFPWIEMMADDPIVQAKAAYLNIPFLLTRGLLGLALLFGLGTYIAYLSIRPDLGLAADSPDDDAGRARWRDRLTGNWGQQEREEARSHHLMMRLGPPFVLLYAVVMSLLIFDWAMSLEPHWFSTMFGAWFFMGAFWGGIVSTAVGATLLKRKSAYLDEAIGHQQLHDLGKLSFAFTVFWAYLFWSQYLVIWYGNLPWEQAWIILRSAEPWGKLSLTVIVLCFFVPFAGLIGKAPKVKPGILRMFGALILLGLWLERYMLIHPSLRPEGNPVFDYRTALIGVGFLGLLLFSLRWFMETFPIVQIWQPLPDPEMLEAERPAPAVSPR